jgi:flagella basal body P-ring formation protein FlgA
MTELAHQSLPMSGADANVRQVGAVAIVLVLLGVIVGLVVYSGAGKVTQVFVVSETITRGSVTDKEDLATISIAADQSTTAFPTSQAADVTGTIAAVDIPPGGLVTHSSVTAALDVPKVRRSWG